MRSEVIIIKFVALQPRSHSLQLQRIVFRIFRSGIRCAGVIFLPDSEKPTTGRVVRDTETVGDGRSVRSWVRASRAAVDPAVWSFGRFSPDVT